MQVEPIHILAVDDIEENLVALDAALRRPGVEIVRARSGFEALELMLRQDFALALLDVQMPEMDGFELAELMRGTERTRHVPIIFLTAVATEEKRRFRGFEAGAVDYLLKPLDLTILASKVNVFVELAAQRKELARQRDEIAMALGRLRAHGDNSPLAVLELDAALRICTWTQGGERMFGYPEAAMIGLHLSEAPFLIADEAASFLTPMQALLDGDDRRTVQEHRFRRADGEERHGEWHCSALAGLGHYPRSLMIQVQDVTERKRAEETRRLLIGELNHRVKNTLATVQAIAAQGLRHAASPADFQHTFTGRLQALARAHSLLSSAVWESAGLRHLIEQQLAIGAIARERLSLDGPDIRLAPEPALRFALVLHELATNAHKYGALSNDTGTVALSWSLDGGFLSLQWVERGGPPVAPPEKSGFGTQLIRNSLSPEGGTASIDFPPEGMRASLTMAVDGRDAEDAEQTPPPPAASAAPPAPPSADAGAMNGRRVLIVEDEPLVAMDMMCAIEDIGAEPVGPATSCAQALEMIASEGPEFVLLDGNLNGEPVDSVARALDEANIPFAFVSGYDAEHLPSGFGHRPVLGKPYAQSQLEELLHRLAAGSRPGVDA